MWDELTIVGKFFYVLAVTAVILAVFVGIPYLTRSRWMPAVGKLIPWGKPTPTEVARATPVPIKPTQPPVAIKPTATPVLQIQPTSPLALPKYELAFDPFASYYIGILIKQLGLDQKYGFDLELVPFYFEDQNEFPEAARSQMLKMGEWGALLTTLDKLALDPTIGWLTALVDETDGADAIVVDATVRTINDLRGKRIAFSEGSVGEYFVCWLLYFVKIPVNEVTLIPCSDVATAVDLFVKGQVQVVSAWEPDVNAATDAGGHRLIDSGRLRVPVDVILVSDQAIKQNPTTVMAFHNAWFEALKYLFENPAEAEKKIIDWGHNEWSYVSNPGDLIDTELGWLTTIAQAGIGPNQIAMQDFQSEIARGKKGMLVTRLEEAKAVWQWAGKAVPEKRFEDCIDPRFVLQAAQNPALLSRASPVNDSFIFTKNSDVPKLTKEELGQVTVLAELPLRKIQFQPDDVRLTDEGEKSLREEVLPFLRNSPRLYLKVTGSAALPPGEHNTPEDTQRVAEGRVSSVIQYLTNQGIDSDRLIISTVLPQHPRATSEALLELDRFVEFIVVEKSGY